MIFKSNTCSIGFVVKGRHLVEIVKLIQNYQKYKKKKDDGVTGQEALSGGAPRDPFDRRVRIDEAWDGQWG